MSADIADELLSLPLFHAKLSCDDVMITQLTIFLRLIILILIQTDISVVDEGVVNVECMSDVSVNASTADNTGTDRLLMWIMPLLTTMS